MKRIVLKGISLVFAVLFAISALISVTYAWENEQQATNNLYGSKTKFNSVELVKLEKSDSPESDEIAIPETAFYLFKANGVQIGGRYVTDRNGKINVSLPAGNYYFEEASPAVGYTYDTDKNGNRITKYEFSVKDSDAKVVVKAYNTHLTGDLLIRKTVKNSDNSPLTDIQKKTDFTFTVTFSDSQSYTYTIDNGEEKTLKSGEALKLRDGQTASFKDIPVGVLYNVSEASVAGYACTSTGHRGNISNTQAVADFVNVCDIEKMGKLTVTKKAEGNSENADKEFKFTAKIGGITEEFTLKSGKVKTFGGIPLGTKFVVTEQNDNDYISAQKEYSGHIANSSTILLPFNNIYDSQTSEKFGSLTVKKAVEKNADNDIEKDEEDKNTTVDVETTTESDKEFGFKIVFDDGKNKPQTKTFTLKAGEEKTFDNLPSKTKYTIEETDANDYLQIFDSISGVIAGDYTAEVKFVNVEPKDEDGDPKTTVLSVTKRINGDLLDADKSKEFSMTLLVGDEKFDFKLKADETKTFEIPVGVSYELREHNYFIDGFSQTVENGFGISTEEAIKIIVTNTYSGEPRIEINGEKSWELGDYDVQLPESVTVQLKNGDLLLEEKTVTPDDDGNWKYTFVAPKYNSDGSEAEYTVEELPITSYRASYDGYDILNTYVAPLKVEIPAVTKVIEGDNAPKADFEFLFKGKANAPMPEGSEGSQKLLKISGEGTAEVGTITFTDIGEYTYTVYELSGNESGWKYDTSIYTITFVLSEDEHKLSCKQTIMKNNDKADSVVFTNTFDESKLSTNVKISGTKTWIHGDNPEAQRPKSIIVFVYGDGELAAQRLVTASDNWKYSFDLPRKNADGETIKYTIDEAEVEGYTKQISGYDLINTYDGKPTETQPSISGADGSSSGNGPSQTGDTRNPTLWVILMLLSLTVIVVTMYLGKRQKPKDFNYYNR